MPEPSARDREEARRIAEDCDRDAWVMVSDGVRAALTDAIARALAAREAAVREACIAAVCPSCAKGVPADFPGDIHRYVVDGRELALVCPAAAIRAQGGGA